MGLRQQKKTKLHCHKGLKNKFKLIISIFLLDNRKCENDAK